MISRRAFLQVLGAASAGLTLGGRWSRASAEADALAPSPWIRIGTDGIVTVFVARAEIGQRVRHASALLVAEELEADWSMMRVQAAPVEPAWHELQSETTTSMSMVKSWHPMRQAGAVAREMLVTAAARRWGVEPAACRAENGGVLHPPTGRAARYGELAAAAALLPVPDRVALKQPSDFRYIGHALPSVDARELLLNGRYGMDARPPGLRFAVLARPPTYRAKLVSCDLAAARRVPGVRLAVELAHPRRSVAVVAEDTWSALRGREALAARWSVPETAPEGVAAVETMLRERFAAPPEIVVRDSGQAEAVLASGTRSLHAEYFTPYQAHAPMEPMSCAALLTGGRCEVWVPTQNALKVRDSIASAYGLDPSAVTVHPTLVGGGFGQRSQIDYVLEAVELSRLARAPVQVMFTRTDDLHHSGHHPAALQRLAAALDHRGVPSAWTHFVVGAAGLETTVWGGLKSDVPYAFAHQHLSATCVQGPHYPAPWRSVSRFHIAFARESFIDEIADLARRDPLEMRLAMLSTSPRLQTVLRAVAKKIGWGTPGASHGLAVDEEFGTVVALAAEIKLDDHSVPRLSRMACAVDCGSVVDPRGLAAQLEGGIVFGLSATLHGEITIASGIVQQNNFDDYPICRIHEVPPIEIELIRSTAPPTGAGEVGVPVVAPAVANALFAATGRRLRRLPLRDAVSSQ
jgi:isoquinoline 1-oxidoreductase beta subunit